MGLGNSYWYQADRKSHLDNSISWFRDHQRREKPNPFRQTITDSNPLIIQKNDCTTISFDVL
jgi:hypothetical protein